MELTKMIGVEFYGVIQEFVKIIVIWRSKTLPKGFAWYFVIAQDYIRPRVSSRPKIIFIFWIAWPDAPLTRLSITENIIILPLATIGKIWQ